MKTNKIVSSGLIATSLMTAFSYLVAGSKEKNFREPELLADLEKKMLPGGSKKNCVGCGLGNAFYNPSLLGWIL